MTYGVPVELHVVELYDHSYHVDHITTCKYVYGEV